MLHWVWLQALAVLRGEVLPIRSTRGLSKKRREVWGGMGGVRVWVGGGGAEAYAVERVTVVRAGFRGMW